MGQKSKTTLKSFFETGDIPLEVQFADFIDSYANIVDESTLIGKDLSITDVSPSLQNTAFQIVKKVNVIDVTHVATGAVKMPAALPNRVVIITNVGGDVSDVYPLSGEKFLLESVNDPIELDDEQSFLFIAVDTGVWSFVDLAPVILPTLSFADLQEEPSDPTGTSDSTGVMMGIAVLYTPTATGRVLVVLSGDMGTSSGSGAAGPQLMQLRYGTGTPPANDDALTGTAVGAKPFSSIDHGGGSTPFSVQATIPNLVVDTEYWFDFGLREQGLGTGSARNLSISIMEFPAA